MTAQGIARSSFYVVVLVAARLSAGRLHGAGVQQRRLRAARPVPLARRDRARLLPRCSASTATREQDWKSYAKVTLIFSAIFSRLPLRDPPAPGPPVPEPGPPAGRPVAHRAEHDSELHHEHELAVLRRRVHDVVPDPDGRARGAELRLGCGRDGGARRGRARNRAALAERDRQLLARPLPLARLHPAAAGGRPRRDPDLAGRRRRRSTPMRPRRRCRARTRRSRAARPLRRSRSSSSGRTAAASTTRTPPCRSRTRTGSRTSSRCSRSC